MDWFRFDHGFFSCPKVVRLSREMRSFLVEMWCVSSSQRVRGTIPPIEDMAVHWRVKPGRAREVMDKLIEAGFVDEDKATGQLTVHDWSDWQRPSDDAGALKKAQRSKKKGPDVSGQSRDSPALDTEKIREEKSPPTPQGGRHALITVVDSGDPDPTPPPVVDPPGSPGYRAVMDLIPDGWRLHAETAARNLLSNFPAAAVKYGLEETLDRYEGPFSRKAAGYWRAVVEENPKGRPARPESSRARQAPAPPPPKFFRAEADEILSLPEPPPPPKEGVWRARGAAAAGNAG